MAFGYFDATKGQTPESIARTRALVEALMGPRRAPANTGDGLMALGDGIVANVMNRRANESEAAGLEDWNTNFGSLLSGDSLMGSADSSGVAGEMAATSPSVSAPTGMEGYRDAIASIESAGSGDYSAVGPTNSKLGRPLGRYQVMEANIGPWSREVLGREVSPDEFLANPQLQDAIFDGKFGSYVQQFGPEGAAQAWFAGPGGVGKTGRQDVLGTSVGEYGSRFMQAAGGPQVAAATPEAAIEAIAPAGYADPSVAAPAQPAFYGGRFGPNINLAEMPADAQQLPAALGEQAASYAPPLPPPTNVEALPVASVAEALAAPPVEMAQAGGVSPMPSAQGGRPSVAQLLAAANHPFAPKSAQGVIGALLEQEMKRNDPMTQMQMEKTRLELEAMRNPQPQTTDTMRNLEWRAQQAGLQPGSKEWSDFMLSGGDKGITVDARQMGSIPPGYQVEYNEAGQPVAMVPIPGSPAAAEAQAAQQAQESKQGQVSRYGNVVVEDIDRAVTAIEKSPAFTTGIIGSWASAIPGTGAAKVSRLLDTVKANAGFDRLQAMRDSSPTGGALGSVTERELSLLQAAIGSLEQSQDSDDLIYNLRRVQDTYDDIINGPKEARTDGAKAGRVNKPLTDMSDEELEAIINGN